MKFIELPVSARRDFINSLSSNTGIPPQIIEKDWWVCAVLRAIFDLPCGSAASFKGGTTLSKCWGVISRFSEDIDIAVSRDYLGFGGELSKTQISDKLRRAACSFVRETLQFQLKDKMIEQGIPAGLFEINVDITPVTTTDPESIYVRYSSVFDNLSYIRNAVKVEVSGRSMNIPLEDKDITSMLEEAYPNAPFAESSFFVKTVLPERTFLEKVCLLHEEFIKPSADIRVERMSRHLYDLAMMAVTDIADRALSNKTLFTAVVEHRKRFIGLKGFDYSTLSSESINIIPPAEVYDKWARDYAMMSEEMIYGEAPTFEEIIENIENLNKRLRNELV